MFSLCSLFLSGPFSVLALPGEKLGNRRLDELFDRAAR
jgi:hypothetical protein